MPTLTPSSDMAPQPRVQVVVDEVELDPSTVFVTVVATSTDGEYEVRDATMKSAVGGLTVTDYEVPPGVEVTYVPKQYDVDGVFIGNAPSAATQVDITLGWAVLSDPLAPGSAMLLPCEKGTAALFTESKQVAVHRIGRQTIALMSDVGLGEDVPLNLVTQSDTEVAALRSLHRDSATLLVRTMPPMPLPRAMHVAIPRMPMRPHNYRTGGTAAVWALTAIQVSRPVLDSITPAVTWQRYIDAFATWQDVIDEYTSWLDLQVNPPPEV